MAKVLSQLSRLLVGALFIFSGLIKANDPVGFGIKLEDYFLVFAEAIPLFGADWVMASTVGLAWFIVVFEVACGIALLLGIWRHALAWALLLMILFFTWLTGYSAVTGSVTDCGCFGDAIPLTPWQSFYKDLVLLVLIGIIWWDVFRSPKAIKPFLPGIVSVPLFVIGTAFSGFIGLQAIQHLPFKDFRPYKVGNNIQEGMTLPPDAKKEIVELTWTYKNKASGEIQEFVDELPPDLANWEYMDRVERVIQKGDEAPIHDFMLVDENDRDRTMDILELNDVYFFVVSPDLDHASVDQWKDAIALAGEAELEGIHSFGLVGNSRDRADAFRHEHQAAFPFFSVDQKTLKTILRTDPGLVLLRQGTVLAKYAGRDIPDFTTLKERYFPERAAQPMVSLDPAPFAMDRHLAADYQEGASDLSAFAVYDAQGNPMTDSLLGLPGQYWMVLRDVTEITAEDWASLQLDIARVAAAAEAADEPFLVLSGSPEADLLPMREASGVAFDYAFSDPEWLAEVGGANAKFLHLTEGMIDERFDGASAAPMP